MGLEASLPTPSPPTPMWGEATRLPSPPTPGPAVTLPPHYHPWPRSLSAVFLSVSTGMFQRWAPRLPGQGPLILAVAAGRGLWKDKV